MCPFWYVLHKVADFYKLRTNCHVVVVVSIKHTLQFKAAAVTGRLEVLM